MNLVQFLGAIELGFIYGLVALGVYLSFRILDYPDLTVDGSFPLGAAVAAIMIVSGFSPWLATAAALVSGMGAGLITAWLTIRWKILHLLASILTMTALYSLNLRIMGRPNIALLGEETVFTPLLRLFQLLNFSPMISMSSIMGGIVLIAVFLLYWFLTSEKGLALRATGANARMAEAQGINIGGMVFLGIALSNGIVAFAGALFAQAQGFADVTMGVGTIIVGLAAVILGEAILPSRSILVSLLLCLAGSILYRLVIAFALGASFLGLQASDLNLVTAFLVAIAMILPQARQKLMNCLRK